MSGEQRKQTFLALVSVLTVVASLASITPSVAAAAAPTYNMLGTWTSGYRSGSAREAQNGTWDITQMDMATGAFSGTAEIAGTTFTLTGVESGAEAHQELTEGAYTAHDVYTLSVLGSGHVGTEDGTFEAGAFWAEQGGASSEEAGKKAKEEAEKSAKRPTGTSVTCNYEFATSEDTCVASVGDGGSGTPVTPTGSVTFSTTSGGFGSGASCSLAPTSGSPSVGSCTLVYFTTYSGLPTITATYGGDSGHTGSVGHTQFLGMGEEGTYEAPTGPSGQYPNEVSLSTEVPISGTTVEGTVQSPEPAPAPVPMTLPTLAGLAASSFADLKLTETDAVKVDNSGAQNAKDVKELGESIEKLNARTAEVSRSPSPSEQAEAKLLQKDATETIESVTKMLKKQAEVEKEIIKNASKASVSAARKGGARKPKTRSRKPIAYVVMHNLAAGKLKLKLHLNRAALNTLAGKHNSVKLLLRIDMVLPSSVYKSGLPRSFVESITLKRAPKHKR